MKNNNLKPFYKKWWFWLIMIIIVVTVANPSSKSNEGRSEKANNVVKEDTTNAQVTEKAEDIVVVTPETPKEESVPTEYKNALKSAKSYADYMYICQAIMSKIA